MKKKIVFAMMIITIATFHFMKANKEKKISGFVLANVEALAANEFEDGYFCYGVGSITCPYSGQQVAGYYIRRNIE